MVKETFDLGNEKVDVIHSTEEDASDLSSEEMEEWIKYSIRMRNGRLRLEELIGFIESEEGINNVTRLTVGLERMEKNGELMMAKDEDGIELLYLG